MTSIQLFSKFSKFMDTGRKIVMVGLVPPVVALVYQMVQVRSALQRPALHKPGVCQDLSHYITVYKKNWQLHEVCSTKKRSMGGLRSLADTNGSNR